jgi:hypothetical protein
MADGTMKKAKARAKKGMAKAGNATSLKAEAKDEVTGITVTGIDDQPGPIFEKKMDTEKTSESVELVFGINAGITWESLNLMGPMAVDDLVKATALLPEEIYGALGWLGRENKISVERRGTERVYSLRL